MDFPDVKITTDDPSLEERLRAYRGRPITRELGELLVAELAPETDAFVYVGVSTHDPNRLEILDGDEIPATWWAQRHELGARHCMRCGAPDTARGRLMACPRYHRHYFATWDDPSFYAAKLLATNDPEGWK